MIFIEKPNEKTVLNWKHINKLATATTYAIYIITSFLFAGVLEWFSNKSTTNIWMEIHTNTHSHRHTHTQSKQNKQNKWNEIKKRRKWTHQNNIASPKQNHHQQPANK